MPKRQLIYTAIISIILTKTFTFSLKDASQSLQYYISSPHRRP